MAKLPPRYVPPVPDEEDEGGDTLVEGLEEDSFDATLMKTEPAPSVLQPLADKAAKALESITEDVVERVDEAMLSLVEQRVVRPLYAIGGAVALRAMVVPGILLFLVGVAFGMPGDDIRKSFPKSIIPVAASAPTIAALPEAPAPVLAVEALPEPEPQPATTAVDDATPAAAPAPRRVASRRAIERRRARARARARARRARSR